MDRDTHHRNIAAHGGVLDVLDEVGAHVQEHVVEDSICEVTVSINEASVIQIDIPLSSLTGSAAVLLRQFSNP